MSRRRPRGNPDDPVASELRERKQKKSLRSLVRLVGASLRIVISANRRVFVGVTTLQVLNALALAGQVLVVKVLLEAVLELSADGTSALRALWLPVTLFTLLTVITSLAGALQGGLNRVLGESVTRSVIRNVLDVATGVSLRHFESPEFYDRMQRVQANAFSRPQQLTQGVIAMASALIASVGVGLSLVSLSPLLLPLLVLGGIPLLLTSRRESRLEFDFSVTQTPAARLRAYITMIQTSRTEATEIRAFDLSPWLGARLDELYRRYMRDLGAHVRRRALLTLAGGVGSAVFLAATLSVLVILIARGDVSVAAAGAAIVAVRILQNQVQALLAGAQRVFESALFLDDVQAFLAMGPDAVRDESGDEPPGEFARIDLDSVTFAYPGSVTPALQGVSLSIQRGEVIALVGENGSGKTTLAKILAGLYDADGGTVAWDGVDVTRYRRSAVRDRVAVIFQDFVRFAFTARENIVLGRSDIPVDPERVARAAAAAGVDDMIEALPRGYETVLSRLFSGGRDLSGGQWQRVALARALYRAGPLVILDEPNAALDARAEHELFLALRGVLEGRTAVVISHRFSSVRAADRIFVLAGGRIIESGSHDELMGVKGHYAELFRLQATAYLPEEATATG